MIEERRRADREPLRGAKDELASRPRTGKPPAYEPPRLTLIGSFEDLTQGGTSKGADAQGRFSPV